MNPIDKLRGDLDFYNEIVPKQEALEAARINRHTDPEVWSDAKNEWATLSSYWLQIAEYVKATGMDTLEGVISAPTVDSSVNTESPT